MRSSPHDYNMFLTRLASDETKMGMNDRLRQVSVCKDSIPKKPYA